MSSASRLLIQIVPRLTPGRCGVTDHALKLASELDSAFGIQSAFVVLNSDIQCDVPFRVVHCAPNRLAETCVSLNGQGPGALLVHVSGYGYSTDGAPALLANGISDLRADGRFRIAAYFHELFATGRPWKSAFWYSSRQKESVRRIAMDCDLLATNIDAHREWLEDQPIQPNARPVRLLPVFSNLGEKKEPVSFASRDPVMVVLGLAGTREAAYQVLRGMKATLQELAVREVWDVGPEIDAPRDLAGVPVKRLGMLAVEDMGACLSRARFGFATNAQEYLGKSGVFGAYCAHGVIPVIGQHFHGCVNGLQDGIHLLSANAIRATGEAGHAKCSQAAWNWYQGHRLQMHAATYAGWLHHPAKQGGDEHSYLPLSHS